MRRHHEPSGNGIHQNLQTLCSESDSTIVILTVVPAACHILSYIVDEAALQAAGCHTQYMLRQAMIQICWQQYV